MTKGTTKRGFIPPQPAAALSVLDFAAANDAFTRAATLALKTGPEEEAVDAAAAVAAELADKVLGVPTSDPAQIGQKIAAYHWLHHGWPGLLTDPALRQRIAQHGDDPSQGLLAIYLDVTHSPATAFASDPVWDQVVSRFEAADAVVEALYEGEDDVDPASDQFTELRSARVAMLNARAPNAKALAYKLARLIESQFTEEVGDTATNPDTISRMLSDDPIEQAVAAVYQDALALAGEAGPLVTAQPDPFDPEAWLAQIEAATGTHIVSDGLNLMFTAGRGGGDLPGAIAANEALSLSHGQKVSSFLLRNRYQAPPAYVPSPPTPPEEIRALFLNGYLNTFPQAERDAIRARLAPAGSASPALEKLITEARAAHVRFEAVCDCIDPVKATEQGREVTGEDETKYEEARDDGEAAVRALIDYRPLTVGEMVVKARVLDREEVPTYLCDGYDAEKVYRLDAEHLASLTGGAA